MSPEVKLSPHSHSKLIHIIYARELTMEQPRRTKIGVCTAAPETRTVYADLNHALQVRSQVNQTDTMETEKATLNAVLSAIVSIFDWDALDTRYIVKVRSPDDIQIGEANADSTNTFLYLAMGSVMNCVKPVTVENVVYVENRWSALSATLESSGAAVPKVTINTEMLIMVVGRCRPYIIPENIVRFLIKGDSDQTEIYTQIAMVYSYMGMKLIEEMRAFSTKPYTCAILLTTVMDQAKDYLAKYKSIKAAHPNHFEYARTMLKNEIEPLDAGKYPDLYWATYYSMKRKVSKNFKTSAHIPITPKNIIKRFAAASLIDYGTLSDENRRVLESLGVNWDLAKQRAGQLLKRSHPSDETSSSDSESDSEPRPKRRRRT